jgi:homogentisate 1,2-dioxygenase
MLDRMVVGQVPRKHHVALRDPAGRLRHEECLTREGFDGPYTILYHEGRPHAQHQAETSHGFPLPVAAVSYVPFWEICALARRTTSTCRRGSSTG